MSRKDQIFTLLKGSQSELKSIGVKSIGVFGSVVRGEDKQGSDCDILVEFEEGKCKYRNFNEVCDLLDDKFGSSYDLVTKDGLSPYIGPRILEEVEYVQIAS